jgi:hypothetical protein
VSNKPGAGMARIKKIDNKGAFSSSTPLFQDRTTRVRYEKTPIVNNRFSIFAFFSDLFRRGPNPFRASPMAAEIDRQYKIEKSARLIERARNFTSEQIASLMTRVHISLQRYWRSSVDRADAEMDKLDGHLIMEKGHLENCRPSSIKSALVSELNKILDNVNPDLGPIAKDCAQHESDLLKFRNLHGLQDHMSWGKDVNRSDFTQLLLIMLVEFVLNTLFFAGSQKSGLIGGAGLAAQLSIAPLALGAALGLCYQFTHPKSEGKGWIGKIFGPVIAGSAIYYLLLLTLARYAGDRGEIEIFSVAASEVQIHPFSGLLDLPALAYFFFSLAVMGAVFFKFINSFGVFPGLWKRTVAVKRSDAKFEGELLEMMDASRAKTDDEIQRLDVVPDIIQHTFVPIKELQMNFENVLDQYKNDIRDIRDAERLLVGVVGGYVPVNNYVEISQSDGNYAADHEQQIKHYDKRLHDFWQNADLLLNWDEVSQASIDKCREEMIEFSLSNLSGIEGRAKALRQDKADELKRVQAIR